MDPSDHVIESRGLTKRFGDVVALDRLDLEVRRGEVFGFLGPNGAGKTTTIRLLMGLLNATSGSVRVLGRDARVDAVEVHRNVGYLPSDPSFPRRLHGRAFLEHLGRLRGEPLGRVGELAARLEVDLDRPIGALSRGNRQKIGVLQAFAHDPALLVLDEPSSGLDPLKQTVLAEMIREVATEGRTVFLSSHVISEVEEVADRVAIIRDGVLATVEDVSSLKGRSVRRAEIRFAEDVDAAAFAAVEGVEQVTVEGRIVTAVVSGSMDALVKAAARHEVETFTSAQGDLTDIFLTYYEEQA